LVFPKPAQTKTVREEALTVSGIILEVDPLKFNFFMEAF
jgi:hypothetical protein